MRRMLAVLTAVGLAASLSSVGAVGQSVRADSTGTATVTMTTEGFVAGHIFIFDPYADRYPDTALCQGCDTLSLTVPVGTVLSVQVTSYYPFTIACPGDYGPTFFPQYPLGEWYGYCGWTSYYTVSSDQMWTATYVGPDPTAPVLDGVPADMTVAATSPAGAVATYGNPTASDPDDAASTPVCLPASGGTFPIGLTTVTCTSSDTHGNTTAGSFTVTVLDDRTPPTVTYSDQPPSYTVDQSVSISWTTSDSVGVVSPPCPDVVQAAWVLGLGSHDFTCSAADAAGNQTTVTATIQITADYPSVESLTNQFVMKAGIAAQLTTYLDAASRAEARGNLRAELSNLASYRSLLKAQIGKSISADDAQRLIGFSLAL